MPEQAQQSQLKCTKLTIFITLLKQNKLWAKYLINIKWHLQLQ